MKFSFTLAAVAALLPTAFGHISMEEPKPFPGGLDSLEPLKPDGSNFPCTAPDYSAVQSTTVIQPGESGSIRLGGSATHGGGSCQISLTYDEIPSAGSKFTVIKSIMGGCPIKIAGNGGPGSYVLPYTIPQDAPSGKAIIAWTWFNAIGNREMYMRCAPITIGGSQQGGAAFAQRPDIFRANIQNGCSNEPGDVIFPNPGPDSEGQGNVQPTGNCGPVGTTPSNPTPPVATSTLPSATAEPSASEPATPILKPGNGAIKLPAEPVETPVESPVEAPVESPVETPVEESPVEVPVEVPAAPIETPETPVESPISKPISPPSTTAPEAPVVSPPFAGATPCDKPGAIFCMSSSTFALCNHGYLVPMGKTAMGTSCVNGAITKRAYPIRLSGHMRRRHGKF